MEVQKFKYGIMYHKVDMDGITSAAITLHYIINKLNASMDEIELLPWNHNYGVEKLNNYEVLYILDLGLKMEGCTGMLNISNYTDKLIWIDHHISGKSDYERYLAENPEFNPNWDVINTTERKSACFLAMEYLYPQGISNSVTELVSILSMYDVWIRDDEDFWNDTILPTNTSMYANYLHYGTDGVIKLMELFNTDFNIIDIVKEGQIMLKYMNSVNKSYASNIRMANMWGYNVLHINSKVRNSNEFKYAKELESADMLCAYAYVGGRWLYTITSNSHSKTGVEVDCSKIAEEYGGGGHVGAAGFTLDYLLF
ncbi:MAG: DHH family phosphoesterase [Bacteroidales bacterium]